MVKSEIRTISYEGLSHCLFFAVSSFPYLPSYFAAVFVRLSRPRHAVICVWKERDVSEWSVLAYLYVIAQHPLTICSIPCSDALFRPCFSGILPVDQMREYFGPVGLLLSRIPVSFFEREYSVMMPENTEPSAANLLTSIAFNRGFMSASGIPDCSRAARFVIKDVVAGRVRWVAPPPGIEQEDFNRHLYSEDRTDSGRVQLQQLEKRGLLEGAGQLNRKVDTQFFTDVKGEAHIRSAKRSCTTLSIGGAVVPEKGDKHHNNKNKKEKLRRIYVPTY